MIKKAGQGGFMSKWRLLFIVSFFVFGNIPAVIAEDVPTVEGEWEVMSTSPLTPVSQGDLGHKLSIVRQGDHYEVKWLDGPSAAQAGVSFSGSDIQIIHVDNNPIYNGEWTPGELKGDAAPATLAQETAGITYPKSVSYTLSADSNSLQRSEDALRLNWSNGHYTNYEILPGFFKETLKRVSGPVAQASLAVASVESRGEFYFLTKDGRKLTGEEANKVPLEEGSKVVTGKDGHIKMTLPDNTTFTVGPNSDLVIDKFVYDPDKSPEKIVATMTKGVFRWVTGKVSGDAAVYKDPAQMKVNLPVVAVGIRGTDFEATVQPDGSGSVVLSFGQLEITEKKTGFTFILNAGEKITFGADGSVSRPVKMS
jgi:hypothetical protein